MGISKNNFLWSVFLVCTLIAGINLDRRYRPAVNDDSRSVGIKAESPVIDVPVVVGNETGDPGVQQASVAHDMEDSPQDDPHDKDVSDCYRTYRFPFSDGRREETSQGSVTKNARATYEEISATISQRWGSMYEDTLFSGGMDFSDGGDVVQNKMLNAVVEQGGFVAAFTGISLTAGHDCLYEQSYPVVLNATMSRLMASAGVRYEAINVAMGNTRSTPYSYCVDAHAGIDADIVSWEMTMEVSNAQCGRSAEAVEVFVRSASVLPRRPAVLVMDALPDQDMCGGEKLKNLLKSNDRLVGTCAREPPEKSLMVAYRDFGLHRISPSVLVGKYACNDQVFSRDNLFKDGKHYPHPMSWHPGPQGHELVAAILFMHYGKVFLDALERLEKEVPGVTAQDLRDMSDSEKKQLGSVLGLEREEAVHGGDYMGAGRGSVLPTARWCTGWHMCEGAGNFRCANTYVPLAGKQGFHLLDMVSKNTSIININKTDLLVEPTAGSWALSLNEIKPPIISYLKQAPPSGMHLPIDMKWVLVGRKESGPIQFEFETKGLRTPSQADSDAMSVQNYKVDDSRVMVCKPDFIDRVSFADKSRVRFAIDGEQTSVARELDNFGIHTGSCVLLEAQVGVGRHTLVVEPLRAGTPLVAVSHVIYPA